MPTTLGRAEILDAGPPHGVRVPWWRGRWAAATGSVLLAVGAAAVLVHRDEGTPAPAPVTVFVTPAETLGSPTQTGFEPLTDGRPAGPLGVDLPVRLALPDAEDRSVAVVGLTGPGVTAVADGPRAVLTPSAPVARRVLHATVDCMRVPHPLPDDAFGVSVSVAGGPLLDARVAPAPGLPAGPGAWAEVIREGCAGWEAAAYVKVTRVAAQVSPNTPEVALSVTITNEGPRPALLSRPATRASVDEPSMSAARIRIAPGGTAVARLVQHFDPCGSGRRFMPLTPDSQRLLGLVALSGDPVGDPGSTPSAVGVPVDPQAQQAVLEAYAQACGGVEDVLALTPPGSMRYGGDVTVRFALDVTPGAVARLRVRTAFVRGWTITPALGPWLVPDASGQVVTTIRYQPDQRPAPCDLPSALDVEVLPQQGHRGILTFRTYLLPQGDVDVAAAQCLSAR